MPFPKCSRQIWQSSLKQSAWMTLQMPKQELLASRNVLYSGGMSVWLEGIHSTNHFVGIFVENASCASCGVSGLHFILSRPGSSLEEPTNFQELSIVRAKYTLVILMFGMRSPPIYCLICAKIRAMKVVASWKYLWTVWVVLWCSTRGFLVMQCSHSSSIIIRKTWWHLKISHHATTIYMLIVQSLPPNIDQVTTYLRKCDYMSFN